MWEAFFTVLFSIDLSLRWLADGFLEFFRTKECDGKGHGAQCLESCNTFGVGMGRDASGKALVFICFHLSSSRFVHWNLHEFYSILLQDLWWNLLDVLCVFIGVVDFAAELLMLTVGLAAFAPLNTLTVIRVLRVVRIIRVVRAPRQILADLGMVK